MNLFDATVDSAINSRVDPAEDPALNQFEDSRVRTGVLLINLGTPDEPTVAAVRRYLKEFLSDRRIVDTSRLLWRIILHGLILNVRPRKIAALYKKIWRSDGSPLLVNSYSLARKVQDEASRIANERIEVAVGMRYGNPSINAALQELEASHVDRILVLPLYPQCSSTTTLSAFEGVSEAILQRSSMPSFRFISQFYNFPLYIDALEASVIEHWKSFGRGEHLLISFHGVPKRYVSRGDPYYSQCLETGQLLATALGLDESAYTISFQSRFGRGEWLQPYTDETVTAFPSRGVKSLDVVCPGFVSDCLETLEEVEQQYKRLFWKAGGERFSYIPALNDRDDFCLCVADMVISNISGWVNGDEVL
jgi:protoporphyrin/coproporphyrin ferrochelatase